LLNQSTIIAVVKTCLEEHCSAVLETVTDGCVGCSDHKSLLHELHSLLRVMLSGKMSTVVSPHNMLYTVWNIIPFFRGYSQQDAQEFLSYDASYFLFLLTLLATVFHCACSFGSCSTNWYWRRDTVLHEELL